ncbi:Pyranose 2-oxidase [Trichoderma cornu-damae]|uniref:Pyranose 2-oxidase n=1 Tax=Trichoderma cornu-damae TaxID=654480 RepID=A0A9P8QPW4_9HYPO|nr:Pyranose 2-oxidase [Trichoderma cornu-damae]
MIMMPLSATRRVGDHKKNSAVVQKDISRFTKEICISCLFQWIKWPQILSLLHSSVQHGQNPAQDYATNLPAAAVSREVGGMGAHWTCCTPRQHEDERSELFTDEEWDKLYGEAEKIFRTNSTTFDNSIRQQLIHHELNRLYPSRGFKSMPLACKRLGSETYVDWTSPASILGELADPTLSAEDKKYFEIRPSTQLVKFERSEKDGKITKALLINLKDEKTFTVTARKYIVCAGAVLTPGILFNSNFLPKDLPALGHYLTEQPMAFCQVVLKKSLVEKVKEHHLRHPHWKELADKHKEKFPADPVPIPFNDPDPQLYFPYTPDSPWHGQVHRDAFGYGEVPPTVDQRLVVDFRWFTYVKPQKTNCVTFSSGITDTLGMPQPTFHFRVDNPEDEERCANMISDMIEIARRLGGFLPGAEPKYLPMGSALHICGTYRAGTDKKESVVDRHSKVWGHDNLVLGGCGVIPTGSACNPTLTAACFALAAVEQVIKEL